MLRTLSDSEQTLTLFADLVLHPAFRGKVVRRHRQLAIEDVVRRNDYPSGIAARVFESAIYGPDHPFSRVDREEHLSSVTRADLRRFHARYFVPEGAGRRLRAIPNRKSWCTG